MKKVRVIALLALLLACFAVLNGCSINITGNYSSVAYKAEGDHAVVVALPNGSKDKYIKIEDTYEGLPVTEIKSFAGSNLESAETIVIGKNVKEIGNWGFSNNPKLKEFVVDEANESFCSVDGVLFTKDMKILINYPAAGSAEYTVPDMVEVIRTKAFYKCAELKKLTLSSSLKSIEEMSFFRCSSLENVTLPEGLSEIAKDAFGYCSTMSEITIPSTVTAIGEYAFFNCTSLLNVTVNNKQENLTLGKSWQPTNNGLAINELVINWEK